MTLLKKRLNRRLLKVVVFLWVAVDFLDVLRARFVLSRSNSSEYLVDSAQPQKIFVASTHWNNEDVLRVTGSMVFRR